MLLESSSPLGPEHKAAISLTHFSCLVQRMKRLKDNEPHSLGITVTMRGKHNCTPAWVSLETHYALETRSCTRTTKFPPIVITGNKKKRFTKCDFKQLTNTQRHSLTITKSAHYISPTLSLSLSPAESACWFHTKS